MLKVITLSLSILTLIGVVLEAHFNLIKRGVLLKLESILGDTPKMYGPERLENNIFFKY